VQECVVHSWKEMLYIALQDIGIMGTELLGTVDGGVSAFPFAACIAVMNEPPFEKRLDHAAQRMVYNTVTEGCSGDEAWLWVEDLKVLITSRSVGFLLQFGLEIEQVLLQLKLELGDIRAGTLALASCFEGQVEIIERSDLRIEMF